MFVSACEASIERYSHYVAHELNRFLFIGHSSTYVVRLSILVIGPLYLMCRFSLSLSLQLFFFLYTIITHSSSMILLNMDVLLLFKCLQNNIQSLIIMQMLSIIIVMHYSACTTLLFSGI